MDEQRIRTLTQADWEKQPGIIWTFIGRSASHFAILVLHLPTLHIIRHKTFHAYTVRRGQGHAQATHDLRTSGGGFSGGAWLRRQGAMKLQDRIELVMREYQSWFAKSELIWIRQAKSHGSPGGIIGVSSSISGLHFSDFSSL